MFFIKYLAKLGEFLIRNSVNIDVITLYFEHSYS